MIKLYNVSKSYGNECVLDNLSLTLPESGFVLLFCESGCGKTTLLNLLVGAVDFESGAIQIDGSVYRNRVEWNSVKDKIAYIPQNVRFVDYLSVMDNLRLCSGDDESIENLLKRFGLNDKRDSFPSTLSGGERQRAAVIQALLARKQILLLDEPTAALDPENKRLLFRMLADLKNEKLIICSSHDPVAKEYADDVIDFECLPRGASKNISEVAAKKYDGAKKTNPPRRLWQFFRKWYHSPVRERKSRVQLAVVLALTFLALCLGDTPQHKIDTNAEYVYRQNQLQIISKSVNEPLLRSLRENPHVQSVDLIYSRSVPDGVEGDSIESNVTYDLSAKTIPLDASAFRLSDKIYCGTYFTKPEQVMLSYEQACSLGKPENLIGETLNIELYDKSYDLEIVGVFSQFSDVEKEYLTASGILIDSDEGKHKFLNSAFTERYLQDETFMCHGNRMYVVYFDSFDNMKEFYENNQNKFPQTSFYYAQINVEMKFMFEKLFMVLIPMVLLLIPVTLLFYFQIQKIEMAYNRDMLSIYQYIGYSEREIRNCWVFGNIIELLKLELIACPAAALFMVIFNLINRRMLFIPFQVFTFQLLLILAFLLLVIVVSVLLSLRIWRANRESGWYSLMLEQRDLI